MATNLIPLYEKRASNPPKLIGWYNPITKDLFTPTHGPSKPDNDFGRPNKSHSARLEALKRIAPAAEAEEWSGRLNRKERRKQIKDMLKSIRKPRSARAA